MSETETAKHPECRHSLDAESELVRCCLPALLIHCEDNALVRPLMDLQMRKTWRITPDEFESLWAHAVDAGLIPADWDGPYWHTVSGQLSMLLTRSGLDYVRQYQRAVAMGDRSVRADLRTMAARAKARARAETRS